MSNLIPIVHYVYDNDPPGCRPAIVTSEFSGYCRPADLAVFMANGLQYRGNIGYDSALNVPRTWHRLSDHHEEPEPAPDPLELAGRLMAIVTDAWLHARDRTLPQLHNEALAVLRLAQRQ